MPHYHQLFGQVVTATGIPCQICAFEICLRDIFNIIHHFIEEDYVAQHINPMVFMHRQNRCKIHAYPDELEINL